MQTKFIKGLNEVQDKYDTFFIDLWGVIHNGIQVYPGAIKVLENLNKLNKRFILMSNAPRPSKDVQDFLLKLNIDKALIKNVFTSGEAALKSLKQKKFGEKFYHLGPKRDCRLYSGFEENKQDIENADFILCTGLLDDHENSLEYYKNLLKRKTDIHMICTNPDLTVHRGNKEEYCAGTLAEVFKKLGGKVIYFGKPHPEIYNFCINKNESVLVIGDNIRTDIQGANNMKLDSLLITNGIHKDEFLNSNYDNYDKILEKYNTKTDYYQKKLVW